MLTEKIYLEQMKRLEGALNQKIYEGSFKVWKGEIEANYISDDHLQKGITLLVDALTTKELFGRDVHIGSLLRYCNKARGRMPRPEETEEQRRERVIRQNEQAKDFFAGKLRGISSYGHNCLALMKRLWDGEIKIEDYRKETEVLRGEGRG